jgi:nucleoside-diphosphate-sugar epimerase
MKNMSKTLITGGAGFIGSHLADRLLREGHQVTVIDDLSNGRMEFVTSGINAMFADIGDASTLRFVQQMGFDVVFHLAAKPRVSYSVEHPAETNDENVGKTVKLLEACRGNVGRFVFTSSSSVYGGADQLPTPESAPRNPKSPYALQKAVGEDYCGMFSDLYGMDTACVRPFNVFGPRQLANGVYGTVVSSWLHAIKHNGELRSDGDGSQTRDMTHVDNVVDVFMRVAAYKGSLRGEAFNAGCGVSVSNKQILTYFAQKHPDAQSRVKHAAWRPGDVRATRADITACQKLLGYQPVKEFWTGLEETRQWALSSPLF